MAPLTRSELNYLKQRLNRSPNELEKEIVSAEWSEHCSYKSSKKYIKLFPTNSSRVLVGPGYDAGVLDIGNGYVITIHIESHNHPSAVEPYGGAATGVGGVIRDIISMGTRPVALLNALRFGPIDGDVCQEKSKWLLKNVVRGISDYGNCIGIPTVGGEVEFDDSFNNYCLVDVAAIGHGKKSKLVVNKADVGDLIVLAGGLTGRDGIHGASFASKKLESENRSAVQIPDPFLEKLLIDATLEAVEKKAVKAIKDLGGGGLSCCLSETSDNLKRGFDIDLENVHKKFPDMNPTEIMISESQERMLYITDKTMLSRLKKILDKYGILYSVIGQVTKHKNLVIKNKAKTIANMPSDLVAHAPLLDRKYEIPEYIKKIKKTNNCKKPVDLNQILLKMLSNINISSKKWIFQQYDHEIGLRTVIRPGYGDSAVLRVDNDKFISLKLDGNSKLCYYDPYQGTMNILSESCRNVICSGAEPIGIVDHLQFGNPNNKEVFWTFRESVRAIVDFANFFKIPIVGGKVSFYNETENGQIKPTPVIGIVGLIENEKNIKTQQLEIGETIFIIGFTEENMGGSEYYTEICKLEDINIPQVNLTQDSLISNTIINLVKAGLVNSIHDCSKGGLAITLCEMAILNKVGIEVFLNKIPNSCTRPDFLLFSESPSRFVVSTYNPIKLRSYLKKIKGIQFSEIGSSNNSGMIQFYNDHGKNKAVIDLKIDVIEKEYDRISEVMEK